MHSNKEIIQRLYQFFRQKEFDQLRLLLKEDIRWEQMKGFPNGGIHTGREQVISLVLAGFDTNWEGWKAVVEEFIEAGDSVMVTGYYEGVYRQTGKYMKADFLHHYQLADAQVAAFKQYTDTFEIYAATQPG